jgi:hypothetical protein
LSVFEPVPLGDLFNAPTSITAPTNQLLLIP